MVAELASDTASRSHEAAGPVHGLVWAFAFDEAGRPGLLGDEEVPARLASHAGWVWVHLNLTDSRARDWIAQAPLDQRARTVLLAPEPRLHVSVFEGQIVGAVSDFSLEFDGDRSFEVGRLRFAITDRLIVSARKQPLRTIERVREEFVGGRHLHDIAHVFEMIVDAFLDAAHEDLETSSDEIDAIEEALIRRTPPDAGRTSAIRRGLLRLRREVVHLRAALRPLEAMSAHQPPSDRLHRSVASSAPRLSARLDVLDHEIHDLQDRLRLVREEIGSMAAAETNRQLYIISFLTAVFLPGTLVTSMFGMNTKDLPLGQTDNGYWYAMLLVAVATAAVLGALLFRFARTNPPSASAARDGGNPSGRRRPT